MKRFHSISHLNIINIFIIIVITITRPSNIHIPGEYNNKVEISFSHYPIAAESKEALNSLLPFVFRLNVCASISDSVLKPSVRNRKEKTNIPICF